MKKINRRTVIKLEKKRTDVVSHIKDISLAIVIGLLFFYVCSLPFFSIVQMKGNGMLPTITADNWKIVFRTKGIERFDIIAFKGGNAETQIRRVIGLPGEVIEYREDTLLVNQEQIDENFIYKSIKESNIQDKKYTENFSSSMLAGKRIIPKGYYLVLGDNRPYATDSRIYGLIAKEKIIGVLI